MFFFSLLTGFQATVKQHKWNERIFLSEKFQISEFHIFTHINKFILMARHLTFLAFSVVSSVLFLVWGFNHSYRHEETVILP